MLAQTVVLCSGLGVVAEGPDVEYTGSNDPHTSLLHRHAKRRVSAFAIWALSEAGCMNALLCAHVEFIT